jgi:acyl-homoserine-lactone acylase
LAGAITGATAYRRATAERASEILWDAWGVPHIFAPDAPSLFSAFGWAQTHAHGDLLLRLYAQARGRGAEFFGPDHLVSDRAVRTMGLHRRGAIRYAAQPPPFRVNLGAFAAGINAYAATHPDRLTTAARAVLPVDAADVLAHGARILYLFLGAAGGILQALPSGSPMGSNGWAIAPAHTAAGHASLLANPHLFWGEEETWFEAQLVAPGQYDAYGAALVGVPVLTIAFNEQVGWTHTNNTLDGADLYALTPTADGAGYRFDGADRAYETRTETIRIQQAGGSPTEEQLIVRRSVHGPVIDAGGPVAIRLTAVDDWSSAAGAYAQWWEMGRATDLSTVEAALRRLQVPFFTVLAATRDGHILSLFNGQVPVRPPGVASWSGLVPGDTSATLWTAIHPYDDLPKVIDPPGGWVQNSNSPPWYTTYPLALDPDRFPSDMAPRYLLWRERRGIRMLTEHPHLTLDDLVALKYSTRLELADRVVDDLVAAARRSSDATAAAAAKVLATWDRQATPESRGTLLFALWVDALTSADPMTLSDLFTVPWDPADPLHTPAGLKDPASAVRALIVAAGRAKTMTGRLDPAWGDLARLQGGGHDLPANGFPGDPCGCFRALDFDVSALPAGERTHAVGGDSFIAVVEFADPIRARVLLAYGNASQPGSPHAWDQLPLSARGELRPAWRERGEIEANLETREVLTIGSATPAAATGGA